MTEFDNMKRSYSSTIHLALTTGATRSEVKNGNEIIQKFCEFVIENSNYHDSDKTQMKHELALFEAFHEQKINRYFGYAGM